MLLLIVLLTSPLCVLIGMSIPALRSGWLKYLLVAAGAIAPGLGLFLSSMQADAITNAAAYAIAPAFIFFWSMPLAGATFAIASRCAFRR